MKTLIIVVKYFQKNDFNYIDNQNHLSGLILSFLFISVTKHLSNRANVYVLLYTIVIRKMFI